MMWKFSKLILFLVSAMMAGCSGGDLEKRGGGNYGSDPVSISYMKTLFTEGAPYLIAGQVRIEGTVVSSDQSGNFYKTLVIEDKTGGIFIRIETEDYFKKYRLGQTISVACNSLVLGSYGGMIQLGANGYGTDTQVLPIPEDIIDSVIENLDGQREPLPLGLRITEVAPSHIGRLVIFRNVEFERDEDVILWCDDDASFTDRYFADEYGNRLAVRNSSYVSFAKAVVVPGKVDVRGILCYFNGTYYVVIDSLASIVEQ